MRVLVVEDERLLADRIAEGLRDQGMAVDVAYDGNSGLEKGLFTGYDVVVLDRDLPGLDGDRVCADLLAGDQGSRIIMLTAAGRIEQRVEGLNLGADDYLAKPFAFSELVARIRALARRPSGDISPVLRRGDVLLDSARRSVARGGLPVALSPKEFAVLESLMRAEGAVVSAEELLEHVWDENADPFSNTVRVTIARLRAKLGEPDLIETVVGAGYRM